MPNQKDIAKTLGITQATVSRALNGDKSISAQMRKKIRETAKKLGYQQNAYLTVLMSHIRTGRKLNSKGTIGLLIESPSQEEWYKSQTYRLFHKGVMQRADELGFRIESFFLQKAGMDAAKIDQILHARGIKGIILAPPYHGNRTLNMHWERYAAIGVGFGWETQDLNRVVFDQLNNFITSFNMLRTLGYKRIGTSLAEMFVDGTRRGTQSYTAYLDCQNRIPENERIPAFVVRPATSESEFRKWIQKWRPDALLTLVGDEKNWLDAMNIRVPQDMGFACISQPVDNRFARINERAEVVGAVALEQVAAQIARNEFGPPSCPKAIIIEGGWIKGRTVRNKIATPASG